MTMKKPSVFSFLITLLLAAAVCSHGQERVIDSSGNPLEAGPQYFIQPVTKAGKNDGGGLVPAAITFFLCPLGIVQSLLPSQPGLPVIFQFPFSTPETFVDTSVDVNIVFQSEFWICNQFTKIWAVDTSPSAGEVPNILIRGVPGSRNSSFKIEKAGEGSGPNTYKLTSLDGTVAFQPGSFWGKQLVLTNVFFP